MIRHSVLRALAVCLAAFLTLTGLASTALAAKKPIAVGTIEGPQGEATRKRVLKTLKAGGQYEITDAEDLRPGSDKSAYSAMAQALQVEAIVVGKVSRGLDLTLSVIGPDGKLIEDVKLKGGSAPKLEKAIDNELEIAIAGPLGAKAAAAKTEAAPEDEEEETAPASEQPDDEEEEQGETKEEAPSEEPEERGRRPIEVLVGGRVYSRSFSYNDLYPVAGDQVFPYKLAIAPSFFAQARVYPFAFSRDDALSNVGIFGKFEVGIQTTTNYNEQQADGTTVTYQLTNGTSEWQLGLRGRLPLGESELGIFGGYGAHSFILVGDEGDSGGENRPNPLVPDVNYQYLRTGFDARLTVSKLSVGSHFAARFLTSMKNVDQEGWWFPGATGSGIDFGIMAAYQVLPFMSIAAGGDYVRYGFDFNAIPDSAGTPNDGTPGPHTLRIAGGATDVYISGFLGVMFHFDNKPSVSDSGAAVEVTSESEPSEPAAPAEEEEEEP